MGKSGNSYKRNQVFGEEKLHMQLSVKQLILINWVQAVAL